jgi:hypothetical protein
VVRPERRRRTRRNALALAAAVALAPRAARAVDAFEIQVYDGTANAPRTGGLELHVNGVPRGLPTAPPPEYPPNHQAHVTLEPSYGLTESWELGAYLQTTVLPDGTPDFAGVKLRSKLVTPPSWSTRVRLGVNVEVSDVSRKYDAEGWGLEVRPIAAWDVWRLRLAVNPIVDVSLTSGTTGFEPAAMAVFEIRGIVSLGLEYYAALGPLTAISRVNEQEHYLFEVANLLAVRGFELNVGVGEGLTAASNALVAKMIVGYTFGRAR